MSSCEGAAEGDITVSSWLFHWQLAPPASQGVPSLSKLAFQDVDMSLDTQNTVLLLHYYIVTHLSIVQTFYEICQNQIRLMMILVPTVPY